MSQKQFLVFLSAGAVPLLSWRSRSDGNKKEGYPRRQNGNPGSEMCVSNLGQKLNHGSARLFIKRKLSFCTNCQRRKLQAWSRTGKLTFFWKDRAESRALEMLRQTLSAASELSST